MFFADPVSAPNIAIEDGLRARLEFRGAPPGRFELLVSRTAAREIAANFLGLAPDEISDEQVGDVVREMTNMLCGSVLSQLECDSTFDLSAPRIVCDVPSEAGLASEAYRSAFELETGGLALCLELFRNTQQ
jgi:chemotaxis protein CheY-P-specific phosphatase CheC